MNKNEYIVDDTIKILSLLKYGRVIPSLLDYWLDDEKWQCELDNSSGSSAIIPELSNQKEIIGVEDLANTFLSMLDSYIVQVMSNLKGEFKPVILFSGGVDSTMIAWRFKELGFDQVLLANYSFGPGDTESELAENIAGYLGLPFFRFYKSKTFDSSKILDNPRKIWNEPFCDYSTIPTIELAYSVLENFTNKKLLIVDGTGADGCFGLGQRYNNWKNLETIPKIFRRLISYMYKTKSISLSKPFILEKLARIARRSVNNSLESAMLAQNALDGVAYSDKDIKLLEEMLTRWIDTSSFSDGYKRYIWSDIELICEGIFAQKTKSVFTNNGHSVVYPFLSRQIKNFAFYVSPFTLKECPKSLMKYSLERILPKHLIYREKSGFVESVPSVFYEKCFLLYLKECLVEGPVSTLLEKRYLKDCIKKLENGKVLSPQVYNFLWASVFTNRWYLSAV
ncbi:MAG: asparagine synthase C-terminal domain-containing protein [Pseudidiomarina maritima]|nr:asparagine synthase C-terminal domain-containing protein [Pseudidiomarina maritima]